MDFPRARQWGAVDPQGAIAFAKTLGDEKAQGYVLKLMIEGWARKDYAAAKWLDGWPAAPDWEGVCAALIKGIASKDPWVASQTAVASIPDEAGWLRNTAATYLAGAMDRRGGNEELKRWFGSLPVGTATERKFKEKAMEAATKHLAHHDLTAAKQWLEMQPAEPWRSSPAYGLVVKKLAEMDRAAALSWLASIPAGTATVGREAGKRDIPRLGGREAQRRGAMGADPDGSKVSHRHRSAQEGSRRAPGEVTQSHRCVRHRFLTSPLLSPAKRASKTSFWALAHHVPTERGCSDQRQSGGRIPSA